MDVYGRYNELVNGGNMMKYDEIWTIYTIFLKILWLIEIG